MLYSHPVDLEPAQTSSAILSSDKVHGTLYNYYKVSKIKN